MFEWYKKEAPLKALAGLGGGVGRNGPTGPSASTDPNDYPFDSSYYQLFANPAIWQGNPSHLPTSHTATTFTVPSQHQGAIRVIGIGAGSGGNTTGKGGYFDIIIPVNTGDKFKVIVGQGGATSHSSGSGGNGCGGGCGVDGNDSGSGGGGTAFFYANPDATSDATMFPKGVAIAGGGGGGNSGNDSCVNPTAPDPIGGFNGLWRGGGQHPQGGEPGQVGGKGGRSRHNNGNFMGNRIARGSGGTMHDDGYSNHGMGNGGGAGGGGGGGWSSSMGPGSAENAPNGRGWGYGAYNSSGAGKGGDYPMRGGNGFTFNGVNLGGGGGGSHGRAHCGGGWGGGGGAYYDKSGGAGGSGVWGWLEGTTATLNPWSPSNGIPINGGSVGSVTGAHHAGGEGSGNPGWVVVLW